MNNHPPEILAPAGNWDCVRAAVANGADAVYFGLDHFNARMRADNFSLEDLPALIPFLHSHGLRAYVTMNVLIFPMEMREALRYVAALDAAGVDGVIIQDTGLAKLISEQRKAGKWSIELHISTQMTISSPEAVRWVDEQFDPQQIVLARELSLDDIAACAAATTKPIEVFCHGALCVSYSGQCLTSESLGQRSANRGECAQACRLPYQLEVDGRLKDLGEQRYLFSPQDLCAQDQVAEMLKAGVRSFKIEGRLKSPEYVAATTRAYRQALDAALGKSRPSAQEIADDLYSMQMSFSRGFSTGWLEGSNHPKLTHGRFGKKRGALAGRIAAIGKGYVELEQRPALPIAAGDGFVIDAGEDRNQEQGGRIWKYEAKEKRLYFHGKGSYIEWERVQVGQLLWKTADPQLDRALHNSWCNFARHADRPQQGGALDIHFTGQVGQPLTAKCRGISISSEQVLQEAQNRPLTPETLEKQFGRLGETEFSLGKCTYEMARNAMLPIKELNQMRRALVEAMPSNKPLNLAQMEIPSIARPNLPQAATDWELSVLCREPQQALEAAKHDGIKRLYLDFTHLHHYKRAAEEIRAINPKVEIWPCTLRIMKHKEQGMLKPLLDCQPDGILVRNLGALQELKDSGIPLVGDFGLNMANNQSVDFWKEQGLQFCNISYDLNAQQVSQLLARGGADFSEITLHQHMPLFHMEHCLFCTFLSEGKNHLDCGRPCEYHKVRVLDRTGVMHYLRSDEGCRNTLFHAQAQTAANHVNSLMRLGLSRFRIELLDENEDDTDQLITMYQGLLKSEDSPERIITQLQAMDRLGICKEALL